jgi:pyruvate/2-oxoglutarate dehydrogenase complex dihydrolipoamide dehydrogenase (E3) component
MNTVSLIWSGSAGFAAAIKASKVGSKFVCVVKK